MSNATKIALLLLAVSVAFIFALQHYSHLFFPDLQDPLAPELVVTVVDERGEAIPGVYADAHYGDLSRVAALAALGLPHFDASRTDERGQVSLHLGPAHMSNREHSLISVYGPMHRSSPPIRLSEATEGKTKDAPMQLRVVLRDGVVLAGQVVDLDGQPRAEVFAVAVALSPAAPGTLEFLHRSGLNRRYAKTDTDGHFVIRGLDPRWPIQVQACAAGGFPGTALTRPPADEADSPAADLVLRLPRGQTVTGLCVDESGNPLPKGRISVMRSSRAERARSETPLGWEPAYRKLAITRADAEGRFTIRDWPSTRATIYAHYQDSALPKEKRLALKGSEMREGAPAEPLKIILRPKE